MINNSLFTSNKDDWTTPQSLFDELDAKYHFALDVAASKENTKCAKYFDKEADGLVQAWNAGGGACWCNPPYGSQLKRWVAKAAEEARRGVITVMLIPARTDTSYFHDYIYGKHEIVFLRGRLKFSNSKNAAPFPSMLVVFKPPVKAG